jgi:hypothetical protein
VVTGEGAGWGLTTLVPAIRTGLAVFDGRRLPRDEFGARARAVTDLVRGHDLGAAVVVAHAATPAAAVYLTNFAPTARVAVVILVPGKEPVLMAGMGGRREAAYQRTVSWVHDLVHEPFSARAVRDVLAGRGVAGGPIGVAGLDDQLPVAARDRFVAEMAGFELVPLDREVARLRRPTTQRERLLLGEIDDLLRAAEARAVGAFRRTSCPARAMLEADRYLRDEGVRDVRILLGRPDGSLRPLEHVDGQTDGLLVSYLAVEYLGYWGECALTFPWSSLRPAADLRPLVAETVAALRPGPLPASPPTAEGTSVEVRGTGVELVGLPDADRCWEELEAGDVVSVVAGSIAAGRVLLHSRTCVVGVEGPDGARGPVSGDTSGPARAGRDRAPR